MLCEVLGPKISEKLNSILLFLIYRFNIRKRESKQHFMCNPEQQCNILLILIHYFH